MSKSETVIQTNLSSNKHNVTIDNTTYEVQTNYIGKVPIVDLLKNMIKRDIEKMDK